MYVCPAGAELSYGTTDRNGYWHYRSGKTVYVALPETGELHEKQQDTEDDNATCVGKDEKEGECAAAYEEDGATGAFLLGAEGVIRERFRARSEWQSPSWGNNGKI